MLSLSPPTLMGPWVMAPSLSRRTRQRILSKSSFDPVPSTSSPWNVKVTLDPGAISVAVCDWSRMYG